MIRSSRNTDTSLHLFGYGAAQSFSKGLEDDVRCSQCFACSDGGDDYSGQGSMLENFSKSLRSASCFSKAAILTYSLLS